MKKLKLGFTLAEVLITLAIIGVVAAMTIPTLITKMNQRAAEARQKTIEARLLDGINRYSTLEDGLSKPYETTYDFLVGLSKHYKMAQICRADEITNCIPYDVINYDDSGTPASIEVKKLQNIDSFMATGKENYLEPASFITAQGTPVIMAFKKDCAWDTGKAMRSIQDSGCIAYMYDESGARLPNKYGVDIVPHGLTITGKGVGTPIATVGGYKIMEKAFFPQTGLTYAECSAEISKNYGITKCSVSDDRWAAAMKYCHDKGYRLPNKAESLAIVYDLYKNSNGNHPPSGELQWSNTFYKVDTELVSTLGLKKSDGSSITENDARFILWSSVESGYRKAYERSVGISGNNYVTGWSDCCDNTRESNNWQALCISD